VVDALVCEPGKRPAGAPPIDQILGSVTGQHRDADGLTVTFEPTAAKTVQGVVEAERRCCSTLGWDLETADGVRLRISGGPHQLDTLEAMFGAQTVSR
jgi:hypothetical protein